MQVLECKYPTKLAQPGKPERREQEYIRHGTRVLMGSFVVPTGELVWDVGQTRTSVDFAAHLKKVAEHFLDMKGFDWVLDNLNTHWSLEVCELVAGLSDVAFEPKQLKTGVQRLRVPHRSISQARLSFHAQAWLVAEPSGTMVQHSQPTLSPTWRLLFARSLREPAPAISRRLQRLSCTSVPMDLYGPTAGPRHSVQCNATTAETRQGLVQPASATL